MYVLLFGYSLIVLIPPGALPFAVCTGVYCGGIASNRGPNSSRLHSSSVLSRFGWGIRLGGNIHVSITSLHRLAISVPGLCYVAHRAFRNKGRTHSLDCTPMLFPTRPESARTFGCIRANKVQILANTHTHTSNLAEFWQRVWESRGQVRQGAPGSRKSGPIPTGARPTSANFGHMRPRDRSDKLITFDEQMLELGKDGV